MGKSVARTADEVVVVVLEGGARLRHVSPACARSLVGMLTDGEVGGEWQAAHRYAGQERWQRSGGHNWKEEIDQRAPHCSHPSLGLSAPPLLENSLLITPPRGHSLSLSLSLFLSLSLSLA